MTIDWHEIRQRFPVVKQQRDGMSLLYLDNAATSQKPQSVLDAVMRFYTEMNANVHRAGYWLGSQATTAYEQVRTDLAAFLGVKNPCDLVFTKGATEGINCVAYSFVAPRCQPGDEIIISLLEHHSNIVPWQQLVASHGVVLKVIPMTKDGAIDYEAFVEALNPKVRFCSLIHTSNVTGVVNDIKPFIDAAHAESIPVLVDATQTIAHHPVDVSALGCDFLVFSGHKAFAPTGIGAVYMSSAYSGDMRPYQTGGSMIKTVTLEETVFQPMPFKFEAGTPPMAAVIGLGEAIAFMKSLGWDALIKYENTLLHALREELSTVEGLRCLPEQTTRPCVPLISFTLANVHAHDLSMVLDQYGIAARAGHHCTMPLLQAMHCESLLRVSLSCYHNLEDIKRFGEAMRRAKRLLVDGERTC